MLIDSPRITPADRAAWARWEAMDRRMAQAMAGRLDRLADTARQIIADFGEQGPCYASISWGKDSVIVAHLVATSGLPIPLAYATSADVPGRIPNPDSERVRDAFLARFPNVDYREYRCGVGRLGEMVGTERYISGLRGAGSGQREKSMRGGGGWVWWGRWWATNFTFPGCVEPSQGSVKKPWDGMGWPRSGCVARLSGGGMPSCGHISSFMICRFIRLMRKSTRLNSSHVKISYAVFCLKKKID